MKRNFKGGRLLVALLVGAMTLSAAKMPVSATEDQAAHEYSAPTNPRWDEVNSSPGFGFVDITDETRGCVVAALYRNGEQVVTYSGDSFGKSRRRYDFYRDITESGSYTFKVKMSASLNNMDARDMSTGSVSVESEPFEYTRPSEVMATPGNVHWSSVQPKVAMWDSVDNAAGYMVWLFEDDDQHGIIGVNPGSNTTLYDFSNYMSDTENHKYTFTVSAYSSNINKWANGSASAHSAVYSEPVADPRTSSKDCEWDVVEGKSYWYENGVKQGTVDDPKGVFGDGTNRGREICDPSLTDDSGQQGVWFWLDSVYDGAKAVGKEVWVPYIYQDEDKWSDSKKREVANESDPGMGDLVYNYMKTKKGKWVRYDENGRMLKGWVKIEGALAEAYPDQAGNVYYYDTRTGLMAKGVVTINGDEHEFDETTGVLIR